MASNHTSNYNLNQWEPEDKVLREEFNADNQKIDEVLGKMGKVKQLKTVVLSSSNNSFDFDLSGVDWSTRLLVGVTVDIPLNNIDRDLPFTCSINENTVKGHSTASDNKFALFEPYPFTVILMPFHTPSRAVEGIYLGQPSGVSFGDCTFEELTSINFGSSIPYPAGTSAALWLVN